MVVLFALIRQSSRIPLFISPRSLWAKSVLLRKRRRSDEEIFSQPPWDRDSTEEEEEEGEKPAAKQKGNPYGCWALGHWYSAQEDMIHLEFPPTRNHVAAYKSLDGEGLEYRFKTHGASERSFFH